MSNTEFKHIKGVNLGNWLVLEKWMHPDLFAGTTAEDEDELCRQLPRPELEKRLKEHRDTYITKSDFEYIKQLGLNTIRIPVPHFIFGDDPEYCLPYVSCIEYLDLAFDWAEALDLKILIDVHTAPESQNGFDNGGICGVCKWAQSEDRIQRLLDVLEKLAERYGKREGLWGIEMLNEPISEPMWQSIPKRYPPHDPQRAEGSDFVPLKTLKEFYLKGYEVLRRHMDSSKAIVIHDGFRYEVWSGFMTGPEYENVILDAHWYLGFGATANMAPSEMMSGVMKDCYRKLEMMQKTMPVIIGEWCVSNDCVHAPAISEAEKNLIYRMIGAAQLLIWEKAHGYFFWSYKLISNAEGWDMRKAVENGWLPEKF